MWERLKRVKKFTPKAQLDQIIGPPLFQLEDRPVYYYGGGMAVYFSPRCFRIEGIQRVEYGEPGEYAVGVYHFSDTAALKEELGLSDFSMDDAAALEGEITDGVSYQATYDEVCKWARENRPGDCRGGETRRLKGEKMVFKNLFLMCGQYDFYFYGKSKRTKLTGFRFVFDE